MGAGLTLDTSRVGQNSILLIIEILSRPGLQSVRQWPAKDNGEWRHCTDVLLVTHTDTENLDTAPPPIKSSVDTELFSFPRYTPNTRYVELC